jgi:Cap4 dsDNA endonuclease
MQKTFLEGLLDKPQRETVGSDTSSRFDYQKNWTFCEMLRRHMDNAEYLVAFEFHDDAVFLTPSVTPTSAEFFQVKTSKSAKARKLADLTARPKNSNSILGKMFQNFDGILAGYGVEVILVSNVAFEFSDQNVSAKDLPSSYRNKIVERLSEEVSAFREERIDNLHFIVTGVSIEAMQSFLHGEAMELFKTQFGEGHGFNVHSWVRLLQSEITRKNNWSSDKIGNVQELVSKKCIGREVVAASLDLISEQRKIAPDMNLVNEELKSAGWATQDLMRLSKKVPQAVADYNDSTNVEAARLAQSIEDLFQVEGSKSLPTFVADVEEDLLGNLSAPYDDRWYLAVLSVRPGTS